jgi:hypothetical protein
VLLKDLHCGVDLTSKLLKDVIELVDDLHRGIQVSNLDCLPHVDASTLGHLWCSTHAWAQALMGVAIQDTK